MPKHHHLLYEILYITNYYWSHKSCRKYKWKIRGNTFLYFNLIFLRPSISLTYSNNVYAILLYFVHDFGRLGGFFIHSTYIPSFNFDLVVRSEEALIRSSSFLVELSLEAVMLPEMICWIELSVRLFSEFCSTLLVMVSIKRFFLRWSVNLIPNLDQGGQGFLSHLFFP
jgi:hypothetical protein